MLFGYLTGVILSQSNVKQNGKMLRNVVRQNAHGMARVIFFLLSSPLSFCYFSLLRLVFHKVKNAKHDATALVAGQCVSTYG